MSLDFLRVDGVMIQKFGLDAAVLHALIEWRSSRRGGQWTASFADIADDIGLARTRLQTARDVLAEAGLLAWSRGAQSSVVWSVITQDPTCITQDPALCPSYREDIEDNYLTDAPLSADSEAPVMTDEPIASVTPIDGGLFPAEAVEMHGPTMDGRLLFAAWVKGYRETYGHDADASVTGPLAGAVRTIAKTRTDTESWRVAWRAFHACGLRGAFDTASVRRELAQTKPVQRDDRPRWNENTHLRMLREQADGTPPPPMLTSRERLLGTGEGA